MQKGDEYFNTSFLWQAGKGITQSYAKRHPVPFGEYVPDRWLYGALAPDLINLIQREYTPGIDPPYVRAGGVGIGLAICFDVIYDDVIWDGAEAGAMNLPSTAWAGKAGRPIFSIRLDVSD